MASKQDYKFLEAAALESYKSPCQMKHGCVAVVSVKIVARGHNHYRSYSKDGIIRNCCTCHAERSVIQKINKRIHVGQAKGAKS